MRKRRDSFPLSREEKKEVANLYFEREVQAQEAILLNDPRQVHHLAETVLEARRSGADSLSPHNKGQESELMAKLQRRRDLLDTQGIEFVKEGYPHKSPENTLQPSPEKTPETFDIFTPRPHGQVKSSLEKGSLTNAPLPKQVAPGAITVSELAAVTNAASLAADIEDIDEDDLSTLDCSEQAAVKAAMEVLARVRAAKVAQSIMKQERCLEQQLRKAQNPEGDPEHIPSWSQGGRYREESPEVDLDRRATSAPCPQWTPELERMPATKGQARGAMTPRQRRDSRSGANKPPKKRVSFGKREEVIIDPGDGDGSDELYKDESRLGKRLAQNRRVSRGPDSRPINVDDESDDKTDKILEDMPKQKATWSWWRKATDVLAPAQRSAPVQQSSSRQQSSSSKEDDDDGSGWLLSAY